MLRDINQIITAESYSSYNFTLQVEEDKTKPLWMIPGLKTFSVCVTWNQVHGSLIRLKANTGIHRNHPPPLPRGKTPGSKPERNSPIYSLCRWAAHTQCHQTTCPVCMCHGHTSATHWIISNSLSAVGWVRVTECGTSSHMMLSCTAPVPVFQTP